MKINFHVLEKSNNQQALLYACQLIEKHHAAGERVYIHTANRQDAERLDQLLWTFKEDSFIPHQVCPAEPTVPVQIGYESTHAINAQMMINLAGEIPTFIDQYEQATEIVFADPTVQQLARERFKQYRDRGYEINTIKM